MHYFRLLWSLLDRPARNRFLILFGLTTLSGFVEILSVGLIIPFIALATNSLPFGRANRWTRFLTDWLADWGVSPQSMPAALGLVFLLGVVCANTYLCFYQWYAAQVISNQRAEFCRRVLREITSRPIEDLDSTNSADLVKLALTDVAYVGQLINAVTQVAGIVTRCVIVYCFFLVAQFKLAVSLAISLALLYVFVFRYIQRPVVRAGQKDQQANQQMYRSANELLGGYRTVRSTATESFFLKRFEDATQTSVYPYIMRVLPTHLTRAGLETATITVVVGLLIYFNYKDGNLANGLPLLSSYAIAGIRLLPAVQQTINFFLEIRFFAPSLEKLAELLQALQDERREPDGESGGVSVSGRIELKNVSYGFDPALPVIREVSLTIEPHSRVALVGETGAGKSTLADLILGLRYPQKGSLEVAGKRITAANARCWRRSVGYVPQVIYLLDDTLAANLAFGIPPHQVDHKRVVEACRAAKIWDFIESLPEGLETNVGERGVKLSGGQRQRIGIARALYHDPEVVVFDEATSALDTATENSVLEALNSLTGRKTLIVIAHRLNTIWDFDTICVMEAGSIVARGRSSELLRSSPVFARLASHQLSVAEA